VKLIIFDLDQTLVDFLEEHNRAVRRLFKTYFGVDAELNEVDFSGRSLMDNFIELGKLKNVPEGTLRKRGEQMLREYELLFMGSIPVDAPQHILPGARELLEELSRTDNIVVLYTGDSPGIVKSIFDATGLGKYLSFSLAGTGFKRRCDMVRQAILRAKLFGGKKFRGKDVAIIGDSIRDVDCGKEVNALTVAVATGFHSEEELRKRGADYVFKDLADYKRILQILTESPVLSKTGAG